ncbi:TetR family transcriptional regulator [Actinoplanes sp. KI2]|uniref:TetR/AcrR family transcriptional regulator n=1 Tax=Actinoplanes sp. KI2 TaxID=2983315 RepID=UPI0021D5D8F7|nr:TetR family transcriptional regulator [Actinoplanes sp. KI2]MCU7722743.1 TetR family transcriptional regulator [Actinoplanes sp. KI2]
MTADRSRPPSGSTPADDPAAPERRRTDRPRNPEPTERAGEPSTARRARDPQARRDALAAATIEVVAEMGIGRTTHRAVAARAGLPLGATTYYFPTLDALIAAALQKAAVDQEADLEVWADRLRDAPDLAVALVDLVADYMADRQRARIEFELCLAAARDTTLRPLAVDWLQGLHELLTPHVGEEAADNISALLDGTMLHLLVTDAPLNAPALTAAIRALAA